MVYNIFFFFLNDGKINVKKNGKLKLIIIELNLLIEIGGFKIVYYRMYFFFYMFIFLWFSRICFLLKKKYVINVMCL